MKKYEIYLPLKYNDGTEIEASRDVVTVFEAHKDPMNLRDKKDISGGRHKSPKETYPAVAAKTPKVGVSLERIITVTLLSSGKKHARYDNAIT